MADDPDRTHEDWISENRELRSELDRLRGLLGFDVRSASGHEQSWEPTLFSETARHESVDHASTVGDKLALYRSLFGGRTDVYAHRWETPTTGKSGWSPAVRGGWSSKNKRNREYLPLTDDVFASHLRGEASIGIYPLLPGDTCTLLACDFDGDGWPLDALALVDACHAAQVPAILERSRSGDGAHVWVFFESPIPAASARAMGMALLRQAMTKRAELDLASYDRFFPSQDFMPRGSFGNLIALPLNGDCVRRGTTLFLDPTTMTPWQDQWAFLSSVARMSAGAVDSAVKSVRALETGPHLTIADLTQLGGPPAPQVIEARVGGMLSLRRSGLPPAMVAGLKHLASISNPTFHEKERLRFSTWDTPRFIRCYREDLDWLSVPRGLIDPITRLVADAGSELDLTDNRTVPESIDLTFIGTLRPHQRVAFDAAKNHDLGVVVAPPGAGKTVLACALIAHHGQRTLVLVDRKPLFEQWRARLIEFLGLKADQIGSIGGGNNEPSGFVDVAMIQSVARLDQPAVVFAKYGLVVVDECHHLPAVTFELTVRHAATRRWLGLTATPYRRDGLEGIITLQCGPVRHEIRSSDIGDAALVQRHLFIHKTSFEIDDDLGIQAIFRELAEDGIRTQQICADIHASVNEGRRCLVLTQRTQHIDAITDCLEEMGTLAHVLRGGLGKRARQTVADAIDNDNGTGIALIATGSYVGEGFDWPELDTLFLAFPIAFKGRVVQYVGRLLRTRVGKNDVELHDYVDERVPVLARMHNKRLRPYASLGFDAKQRASGPRSRPHRSVDPPT
ncbi:MAG TPA: DEAD/DEAH box helicase family protein [Ilumatobacter sp.]|nr:DEAD/DEAH box helicase family protein [Ilumatobacter sp.]